MTNKIELLSQDENFTIGTNSNLAKILANVVSIGTDTSNVTLSIPQDISSSYNLILPVRQGLSGESLVYSGDGQLKWHDPTVLKQVVSVYGSRLTGNLITAIGTHDSPTYLDAYTANITPMSENSKIFVQFKVNYKAALSASNQISFYIKKTYDDNVSIYRESLFGPYNAAGGLVGQYISNLIDEPLTTSSISYQLGYKINGNVQISDTLGILGYDTSYNNTIFLQEFEGSGSNAASVWNKGADSNGLYYNDGTVHIGSSKNSLGSQNTLGVALELSGNLVGTSATFSGEINTNVIRANEGYFSSNTLYINNRSILKEDDNGNRNINTDVIVNDTTNGLTIKATGDNGNIILDPSGTGSIQINGDLQLSGNINAGTFIGDLSGNVTGTVSSLSNHTTTDLYEGSNLYYTTARVRSNLSGGTGINYDQSTGVFSIGQSVGTSDNVQFNNVIVDGTLYSDDITGSNVTVSNDLVVSGNLRVNGTQTIVNSRTLDIGDNKIIVNADGGSTPDAGIIANVNGVEHEFVYNTNNNAWGTTGDLNIGGNITGNVSGVLTGSMTMTGHILPDMNGKYDIGSAEYKIRHMFVSDNSLWIGDEHKATINPLNNNLEFKRRKTDAIPHSFILAGINDTTEILSSAGEASLTNMSLAKWKRVARNLGITINGKTGLDIDSTDIFDTGESDDWQTSLDVKTIADDVTTLQTSIESKQNIISTTTDLSLRDINSGGNITATAFIGDGSGLTGISSNSVNLTNYSDASFNNVDISGILNIPYLTAVNNSIIHFGSIVGEQSGDNAGREVSLSEDGTILAISAIYNESAGMIDNGQVRVYKLNNGNWTQRGNDIYGEANSDRFGWSASLSSDGNMIAIGALKNDGGGVESGHVRIHEWDGSDWTQKGNDVDGKFPGDHFGWSVSLSSDGNTFAAGALYNDDNGGDTGHARVFKWNNSVWEQIGPDLYGETQGEQFGESVALSNNGNIVAIGGTRYSGANGNYSGHVKIYQWNGTTWIQMGSDILGKASYDGCGAKVSLSKDGNTVAISSILYDSINGSDSGQVRIFTWNGSAWHQKGADIDGENHSDLFGAGLSLSNDGNTIAIGGRQNDDNGNNSGHIRVYQFSNNTWQQVGSDLDGLAPNDFFGIGVALSGDGKTIAGGGPYYDNNGNDRGIVKLYKLESSSITANVTIQNGTLTTESLVVNGTGLINDLRTPSDDRINFNETLVENGLGVIDQVNIYKYDKVYQIGHTPENNPYKKEIGVIAQEIQQIPELAQSVSVNEVPDNGVPMSVYYDQIHSYHIKATQELHELVKTQQTLIEELKTRIEVLEAN